MNEIFLERSFDPPISAADVYAMAEQGAWCMDLYQVDWRGSYIAANGHALLCRLSAPDAESARLALRQAGAEIESLWPGTIHDAPEPAVPNVIVERRFGVPVSIEEIQAIEDAGAWCLQAHGVKFAQTFFALDRRRMICLYQAPDAEAVRLAQRQAEMPVDKVWAFQAIAPP